MPARKLRALLFLPLALFACGNVETRGLPQVRLPQDEGGHRSSPSEWWYANFHLKDAEGGSWDLVVAYFRQGLKIVSLLDEASGSTEEEVDFGAIESPPGPLQLSWRGADAGDTWNQVAGEDLRYAWKAGGRIGVSLEMVNAKPPLLEGGDGLVPWGDGRSRYYSLTRLNVQGTLRVGDHLRPVEGIGWMDHQWGDFHGTLGTLLWEWFSLQLEGGVEIVLWEIFDPFPSRLMTVSEGQGGEHHTDAFGLDRLAAWRSPRTGRTYASSWRITEPGRGIDLTVEPVAADQEIQLFGRTAFWEGACRVRGTYRGRPNSGVAYAELTHAQ